MTSIGKSHSAFTSSNHIKGMLYSLEGELEQFDRAAGHDYLPMDVYIDSRTIREHFHESSIRSRLTRALSKAN